MTKLKTLTPSQKRAWGWIVATGAWLLGLCVALLIFKKPVPESWFVFGAIKFIIAVQQGTNRSLSTLNDGILDNFPLNQWPPQVRMLARAGIAALKAVKAKDIADAASAQSTAFAAAVDPSLKPLLKATKTALGDAEVWTAGMPVPAGASASAALGDEEPAAPPVSAFVDVPIIKVRSQTINPAVTTENDPGPLSENEDQ